MTLLCLQGSNTGYQGRSHPDTTLEASPCTGLQAAPMTQAAPWPMPTPTDFKSPAAQDWLMDPQLLVIPWQLLNAEQAAC